MSYGAFLCLVRGKEATSLKGVLRNLVAPSLASRYRSGIDSFVVASVKGPTNRYVRKIGLLVKGHVVAGVNDGDVYPAI
jgi:hypothetical protein